MRSQDLLSFFNNNPIKKASDTVNFINVQLSRQLERRDVIFHKSTKRDADGH